jgi:predicted alpha/beta hydrolase family esterase
MSKRIFIVHGWGGHPEEGWLPWLKQQLEANGFDVHIPQLPETDSPHINAWVPALAAAVGTADGETYFVGHSMGCQTIARYLASLQGDVKIGGAVFVAGFFKRLTGLNGPEENAIGDEWLKSPLDLNVVRSHLKGSVAIFSDNDPFVPEENVAAYRDILGSEIISLHTRGHFSGSDGATELPEARDAVLKLATR